MFIPPRRITLSGGGIKGFAHVGALEVLHERGYLKTVREYIGISAGAICAFALCVGCSLAELRQLVERLDFMNLLNLDPEVILSFTDTFGLDTGAGIQRLVEAILRGRGLPVDLTFQDLARRGLGPTLRVFTTNLNTCRRHEFSAVCTPTAEVRMALLAAVAVPILFQPVRDPATGTLHVDGGVICHSPFKFLTPSEREMTLSITFTDQHKPKEDVFGLATYIGQIYYSLQYEMNEELTDPWPHHVMFLDCAGFLSLNFEVDAAGRMELLARGRAGAEKFLDQCAVAPVRRRRASAPGALDFQSSK